MSLASSVAALPAASLVARFRVVGIDILVQTDDIDAAHAVAATYAAFAVPLDDPTGPVEVIDHRRVPGRSPVLSLLDRVIDVVLAGLTRQGILVIHAGVVEVDGRALLLAGRSGAGKSTLTLAMARAGAGWLTDELALVGPDDATVLPYPRAIHVSPETVDLMPELSFVRGRPRLTLGGDSEWSVTVEDVERAFGARWASPTRLAGIIVLDGFPVPTRQPHLAAIPAALATMELLRETPTAARDLEGAMARLATITPRMATARLQVGELHATAALVRAWALDLP